MKRLSVSMAFALGALTLGAAVLPYGTHLVKGTFVGNYNTVLRDDVTAKVRAQRSDGTVIAEATVHKPTAEGVNMLLEIPVALEPTAEACKVGETLDCVLIVGDESWTVPQCLKVASPTVVGTLAYNYVDTRTFTHPTDGRVAEVPVEYIQEAESYMNPGETYDPWKDYDGDGMCNYDEYKAGTNPFDPSDRLRIREFRADGSQYALTFESAGGHIYVLSSSDTLVRPDWMKRNVRKEKDGDEHEQIYDAAEDGLPGMTQIFITPVAGSKQEFFKLEAK